MKRVTSIGGVFFKCRDTKSMYSWYAKHLGITSTEYGATFEWRQSEDPSAKGFTAFSLFKEESKYFAPSEKQFMLNFRVENLEALLVVLKEEGVEQIGEMQSYEYGKFAHIMDPEGNKIELWEPADSEFDKIVENSIK